MLHTLGWCMNQAAKSTWGTVCLVDQIWDNQTRRLWMDKWRNRRKGKKHQKPTSLGTSYTHSFASYLSTPLFLLFRRQPTRFCCDDASHVVSCRKPGPGRLWTRLWLWEVEEEEGTERWIWNPSFKEKMWVSFLKRLCDWIGFIYTRLYFYT